MIFYHFQLCLRGKMIGASHHCQSLYYIAFLLAGLSVLPTGTITVKAEDSSSIISRFQEYLRINTAQPNPSYYEASDFISSQAKSLSLDFQILEFVKGKPLLLLKWAGKNPALPSILLNYLQSTTNGIIRPLKHILTPPLAISTPVGPKI